MAKEERHHPTRLINPLGMRVLVRLLPRDERSKAGLYLPANVTEEGTDALYGEVTEVARTHPEESQELDGTNVSGIPDGALILFAPGAGYRVPWDANLRIVDTKDVLATVEELRLDSAH